MTVNPRPIKCKSCAKIIATVLDTGLVPSSSDAEPQSCDTCRHFQPLYDAMQAADAHYATFKDRRDNYRPKLDALVNLRKTHMAFDNWLGGVEMIGDNLLEALPDTHPQLPENSARASGEKQGTKRSRSQSPIHEAHPTFSSTQDRRSTGSLPVRKRLIFSQSVEFRDDYRPSQCYSRNDEAYVRGRYAPPEGGEHLDTSGSDKTFLKFTGMKKIGKEWVDVWSEDKDPGSEGIKDVVADTNNALVADVETEDIQPTGREDVGEGENVERDVRAQRLARRSSITHEATSSRRNKRAKTRGDQTKGRELTAPSTSLEMVPQPTKPFTAVSEELVKTYSSTVKPTVEGEEIEMNTSHYQVEGLYREDEDLLESLMNSGAESISGENERGRASTGWVEPKVFGLDHAIKQRSYATSQSIGTQNDRQQTKERNSDGRELSRDGNKATPRTGRDPKSATEETQQKLDLAVRICYTQTTTTTTMEDTSKGGQRNHSDSTLRSNAEAAVSSALALNSTTN
jgi:hypothetical protein